MEKEKGKHKGHHRIGFWLSVLTAVLVVLGMIFLTLLPFAMEWGAERAILRFGADSANISDIDFNPMTGHLNVFDLQIKGPNGDRLTMEQLVVKADLFPILKKRIRFREISLTGFSIDIRQEESGDILFAGLSIPEQAAAEQEEPEIKEGGKPWGLGLGKLDVKEFSIHLVAPELDETVVLNHIYLSDFETWAPEKHGDHLLRVDLLGGTIDVEGTVRPFTDPIAVSTRIGLRELALESVMPYLEDTPVDSLSGLLSGRGQVEGTLSLRPKPSASGTIRFDLFTRDSAVRVSRDEMELEMRPGVLNVGISLVSNVDLGDVLTREAEFSLTTSLEESATRFSSKGTAVDVLQDVFSIEVSGSYSDTGTMDPSKFTAQAGVSLEGFLLRDGKNETELLRLGSFDIEEAGIRGTDEIQASLTRLRDMTLLPRPPGAAQENEPSQAFFLETLDISGFSLVDGAVLEVEEVRMDSLNAWVLREEEGDLELLKALKGVIPETADTGDKEASPGTEASETGSGKALTVNLNKFTLSGENSLAFRDLSVEPTFNFVVDSMRAGILNAATGETASPADVTLFAGMGKYSAVSVNGTAQAPWDYPDVNISVKFKAIDLPPLTPYTTRYLGYILRSGHLDTDVNILVEKGLLDSKAEIVVNRIEMDAVREEDEQRAEERLGVPVKMALSLLKDKNDDIRLTLPIEGNTRDPEFKISDLVASATGIALKKGITAYYQDLGATLLTGGLIPPGTFGLLGKLFSGVTTMTFDPVLFEPLVQELSVQGKGHLDLLAEKLAGKPDVRLVLCGKVTREDIAALRQADFNEAMEATAAVAEAGTPGGTQDDIVPPALAADTELDNLAEELFAGIAQTVDDPVPAGLPSVEEAPLSDDEKERLIEFAKQRALAVKDYLVEIGGLDPERMFVCYSDVETEEKELPPRVDLSI